MNSIWPRFLACLMVLVLGGCGTVDDQAAQSRKAGVNRQNELLLRKQDDFVERAISLSMEISRLRSHPSWADLARTIRVAQSNATPVGLNGAEQRRTAALKALSRQAELTGEEVYAEGRRLLERSASLERERQALLLEWTNTGAEARRTISAGQYNPKQLRAVLGNTDLFYEMNKSALGGCSLDELGFLSVALPIPLPGRIPSGQAGGGQP